MDNKIFKQTNLNNCPPGNPPGNELDNLLGKDNFSYPPFDDPTVFRKRRRKIIDTLDKDTESLIRDLIKYKQDFFNKKNGCRTRASNSSNRSQNKGSGTSRWVICPVCIVENLVFDKPAGKNYFTIPFTNYKIPNPLSYLGFGMPKTFESNRREGETCGACNGSKRVQDPYYDTPKYQQAAAKISQNSEKLLKTEAKLGLGGSRTSIIQGSETLFVGLGFNKNKSYEILEDQGIAPSIRGGYIPQQNAVKVNVVVGKQSEIAWPQQIGNYTIKCANKFSSLVGSGGYTLATTGPITFSGGITKLTAPEISIGCTNGPLTMEGDSVTITGRTICLAPMNGELFVKGSIANTANTTCMGHSHAETASFTKAACVGTTRQTYSHSANPDVLQVSAPAWGNQAMRGAQIEQKAMSIAINIDSKTSSWKSIQSTVLQDRINRSISMMRLSLPLDSPGISSGILGAPVGYILPGTYVHMIGKAIGTYKGILFGNGKFPCNFGGSASGGFAAGKATFFGTFTGTVFMHTITTMRVFLEPHTHQIPPMMHKHEFRAPDIDTSSETAEDLRYKIITAAQEAGIPHDPLEDTTTRISESVASATEGAAAIALESTRGIHAQATITLGAAAPRSGSKVAIPYSYVM